MIEDRPKQLRFKSLIDPCMPAFKVFCRNRATNLGIIDHDDLLQISLTQAYRFLDQYEEGTNFKNWVLRIIVNQSINIYRKNKVQMKDRHSSIDKELPDGRLFGETLKELATTDKTWYDKEEHHDFTEGLSDPVRTAFKKLTDQHREVIRLAHIELMPDYITAEILQIPEGTVKSRLHRAFTILQRHLGDWRKSQGFTIEKVRRKRARSGPNRILSPTNKTLIYINKRKNTMITIPPPIKGNKTLDLMQEYISTSKKLEELGAQIAKAFGGVSPINLLPAAQKSVKPGQGKKVKPTASYTAEQLEEIKQEWITTPISMNGLTTKYGKYFGYWKDLMLGLTKQP